MSLVGVQLLPFLLLLPLGGSTVPPTPQVLFRGDPVQLLGFGATAERLPMIQAAAEYGLLRR